MSAPISVDVDKNSDAKSGFVDVIFSSPFTVQQSPSAGLGSVVAVVALVVALVVVLRR